MFPYLLEQRTKWLKYIWFHGYAFSDTTSSVVGSLDEVHDGAEDDVWCIMHIIISEIVFILESLAFQHFWHDQWFARGCSITR